MPKTSAVGKWYSFQTYHYHTVAPIDTRSILWVSFEDNFEAWDS
jgi:hypothetical protein